MTPKVYMTILVSAAILLMPATLHGEEKVVAKVDGIPIKESDINEFIENFSKSYPDVKKDKLFREKVIEHLIKKQLLINEAITKKIPERRDVKKQLKEAKEQIIINALLTSELSEKFKNIKVSENEIASYYSKNKNIFKDLKGNPVPLKTVKPYIKQKLLSEKKEKIINDYIESLKSKHRIVKEGL